MSLQRHWRKPAALWRNVKVGVGYEKYAASGNGPETPEAGELDAVTCGKGRRKLFKARFQDTACLSGLHALATVGEKALETTVNRLRLLEIKPSVRGIYGKATVGKGRRNSLGTESTDTGYGKAVAVRHQLLYQARKNLRIHNITNIIKMYRFGNCFEKM